MIVAALTVASQPGHPLPMRVRFLDKLPKDCEDPDVVGRWIGLDVAKAAPSMDAWLLRFFRKMKVAANKA